MPRAAPPSLFRGALGSAEWSTVTSACPENAPGSSLGNRQTSKDLVRFRYVPLLQEKAREWLFLIHLFYLGNSSRDSNLFSFYTSTRIQIPAK